MDSAALAKVLGEIMPDGVRSEVERQLTCFSCFRYLKKMIEEQEWKYAHAAYAKYFRALSQPYDVTFTYDKCFDTDIDRVYELLSDLSVSDFLSNYVDWPQAIRTADQVKAYASHVTDIGLCMVLVLLFREMSGETNTQPYASRFKEKFSKDQWEDMLLFASPDITPLIYKSKVQASSREALKLLKKAGFKIQEQLQIFQMIREEIVGSYHYRKKSAWKCKAEYPWRYLRKLHGEYPKLDLLGLNEQMDSAAKSIAKVKLPTDYLTAIYDLYQLDDSDLEHDFILPAFLDTLYWMPLFLHHFLHCSILAPLGL